MQDSLFGQVDVDDEKGEALGSAGFARFQRVDPAASLQLGEQAARTLVAQQVAEVALGLGLVVLPQVGNRERDVQLANVFDGHDAALDLELVGAERVLLPLGRRYVLVLHAIEQTDAQLLQIVQRFYDRDNNNNE